MKFSNVRYRSICDGNVISFNRPCSFSKRGFISRVTFSNDSVNFNLTFSNERLLVKADGEVAYSLTLVEGLSSPYVVSFSGGSFDAEVLCKKLNVSQNDDKILIDCEYQTNVSNCSQFFVVSIIIS